MKPADCIMVWLLSRYYLSYLSAKGFDFVHYYNNATQDTLRESGCQRVNKKTLLVLT